MPDPAPQSTLSSTPVTPRRRYGWAFFFRGSENLDAGRIRWGRVAAAGAVLLSLGYLSLAAASFGFVRYQRQMRSVEFLDLALPWRWENYRSARGDHHLANARRAATEGRHYEAMLLARTGLAQSPRHRDGRLLLAELLVGAGRGEVAREVLLEGMADHGADPVYLRPVLALLLIQQEDARIVALARRALAEGKTHGEAARLLALAAATAAYYRGTYDQAEEFLSRGVGWSESRDGRFLRAKIDRDRGWRELALMQLRQLAAELPRDEEVQRELAAQLRALGRSDEARRVSLALQIARPDLAGPRIELLHAWREAGDVAGLAREVAALQRDFSQDQKALLALAEWSADTGDVALARRLVAHAADVHLPTEPFALLAVEAAVVARDYRGALEAIRGLLAEESGRGQRHPAWFDSLQAIAHLGLGDPAAARVFLSSFLSRPDLRAGNLLAVANRLAALEEGSHAWQTLARAVEIDPQNQAALTRLIELDLALNRVDALPGHVQGFVTMRRPSPDILRVVHQRLGSDLFLLSAEAPAAVAAVQQALVRAEPGGRK